MKKIFLLFTFIFLAPFVLSQTEQDLSMLLGGMVKSDKWIIRKDSFEEEFIGNVHYENEMYKILHPNAVLSIKVDNTVVPNEVIKQTIFFICCFFSIYAISAVLILFIEHDVVIAATSSIASLGDVGPALGAVIGPDGNYSNLSIFTKSIFIFNMLIGRLEIIPFLILFRKDVWTLKK